MKFLNVQQNTNEWLTMRRSKIGASDCPIIMKKSIYRTPYQLWREKLFDEAGAITDSMKHGSELEPIARNWYSEKTGIDWTPVVVQSDEKDWQIASLDGFSTQTEELLEIKCPSESIMLEVEAGKIPEYWLWQIQHQLSVTNRSVCVLLAFSEAKKIETRIDRNKSMIVDLNEQESVFYRKHMIEFEPPELCDRDFVERTDKEWEFLCEERQGIDLAWKELQAQDEENRQAMIELADGRSSIGFGVKLTKYYQKGSVDYSKIPELKTVDLNRYRKAGADRWRLSVL